MIRILGTCAALLVLLLVAFPFGREAYQRYEVAQRLKPLMNDRDLAAWRDWNGDAISFGRSLYERCQLMNGREAASCDAYKIAIQ